MLPSISHCNNAACSMAMCAIQAQVFQDSDHLVSQGLPTPVSKTVFGKVWTAAVKALTGVW